MKFYVNSKRYRKNLLIIFHKKYKKYVEITKNYRKYTKKFEKVPLIWRKVRTSLPGQNKTVIRERQKEYRWCCCSLYAFHENEIVDLFFCFKEAEKVVIAWCNDWWECGKILHCRPFVLWKTHATTMYLVILQRRRVVISLAIPPLYSISF